MGLYSEHFIETSQNRQGVYLLQEKEADAVAAFGRKI